MKHNLIIIPIMFLFTACDEETTTPDAVACFDYEPAVDIKVGSEVNFNNCSENATTYLWDFGDGTESSEATPTHIYEAGGNYNVTLTSSNDNSENTTSQTITVTEPGGGYFSLDGTQYTLSEGALVFNDGTSKWHSLILYNDMSFSLDNDAYLSGTGNVVYFDILSGKSKFEITGSYTNNTGSFDGTDEDIANMQDLTIYNGFAYMAYDFNLNTEEPEANNFIEYYDNSEYEGWSMVISENAGVYNIDISFTVDGHDVEVFYEGDLTTVED